MKKLFVLSMVLILALVMALSLAACSRDKGNTGVDATNGFDYIHNADTQKIIPIACAIRPTANGWIIINDKGHNPINVTGIEISGNDLKIYHTAEATKVGALCITPDETMVKYGISAGASVGLTSSTIHFNRTKMYGAMLTSKDGILSIASANGIKNPTYNAATGRINVEINAIYPNMAEYSDAEDIIPIATSATPGKIAIPYFSHEGIQFSITDTNGIPIDLQTDTYNVWVGGFISDDITASEMLINPPKNGNFWITGYMIEE